MPHKDTRYAPVRQYDIDEGKAFHSKSPTDADESFSPLTIELQGRPKGAITLHRWEWVTRGVLSLLSVVFFTLWVTSTGARKCTYVAKYSPANEAIEYIQHVKYKGGLHFTTPWRGDESGHPSADIDAAWRRMSTDVKPIYITEEQLHEMRMEVTATTVKLPAEEEGGRYLASLEVTHHLQCLDMLRKATYREYYTSFDPAFQVEDETLMNQLDTCVELVRQALMCYPDLNMVIYYWVRGFNAPFGDSNTIHRCKNFDKILDWATEKAVDVPSITNFHMGRTEDGHVAGRGM